MKKERKGGKCPTNTIAVALDFSELDNSPDEMDRCERRLCLVSGRVYLAKDVLLHRHAMRRKRGMRLDFEYAKVLNQALPLFYFNINLIISC